MAGEACSGSVAGRSVCETDNDSSTVASLAASSLTTVTAGPSPAGDWDDMGVGSDTEESSGSPSGSAADMRRLIDGLSGSVATSSLDMAVIFSGETIDRNSFAWTGLISAVVVSATADLSAGRAGVI